jgi:hypothetical protein
MIASRPRSALVSAVRAIDWCQVRSTYEAHELLLAHWDRIIGDNLRGREEAGGFENRRSARPSTPASRA